MQAEMHRGVYIQCIRVPTVHVTVRMHQFVILQQSACLSVFCLFIEVIVLNIKGKHELVINLTASFVCNRHIPTQHMSTSVLLLNHMAGFNFRILHPKLCVDV